MRKLAVILILLVFSLPVHAATIYKWVDKEGAVNFTDNYSQIPPEYRNQVKTEVLEESQKIEPLAPSPALTPSQKSEGPKRDTYGMGEGYWRDQVRPWQNQLKEAQSNIQSVDARMKEMVDGLSGRFLTPTQHNMRAFELQQLKEEKARYEAQANEANEKLKKIATEAEEAKADPAWLK